MGFAWGPRLQWPTVFELERQVFKLEGVIYYVDSDLWGPWVFLEVKNEFEYPYTVTIHHLKLLSAKSLSIGWFESRVRKAWSRIIDSEFTSAKAKSTSPRLSE